jgi:hypothetical protein
MPKKRAPVGGKQQPPEEKEPSCQEIKAILGMSGIRGKIGMVCASALRYVPFVPGMLCSYHAKWQPFSWRQYSYHAPRDDIVATSVPLVSLAARR